MLIGEKGGKAVGVGFNPNPPFCTISAFSALGKGGNCAKRQVGLGLGYPNPNHLFLLIRVFCTISTFYFF